MSETKRTEETYQNWRKGIKKLVSKRTPDDKRSYEEDTDIQVVISSGDLLNHPELNLSEDDRKKYQKQYDEALERLKEKHE